MNNREEDRITGDFTQYVLSHPRYMHEYGHYIDSQIFGPLYLFAIGIPSLFSAAFSSKEEIPYTKYFKPNPNGLRMHDIRSYEIRANKRAKRHFEKKYGIIWEGDQFSRFPLTNPFK